jgi:arylesterase / paraoxonase
MLKKSIKVVLFILLLMALFALKSFYQSGGFKNINNNFQGKTQKISGFYGTEDITIDQTTGIAFLSSDNRWAATIKNSPVKGAIYVLNLNDSILMPLPMKSGSAISKTDDFPQEDFHPHGISFYETPGGKKMLFVVNHRLSGAFVEIFEYKNDSLQHKTSVKGSLMISPNDVVGVGENQFYFTNDHDEKPSKWRSFKDLLQIGMGNICYFDSQKIIKTPFEGLKYANGINKSADGKQIYLAETTAKKITVFDRNIETGVLTKTNEIDTDTGVDNIELDTEGSLWVGCHPQMLKFLGHAKDEKALSPSEIIKIKLLGNGKFEQTTVYINDGSEISASSVGAVYKDKLLIGPVFQGHIVVGVMK